MSTTKTAEAAPGKGNNLTDLAAKRRSAMAKLRVMKKELESGTVKTPPAGPAKKKK